MRRIRRGSAFLVAFLLTVASTLFFVGCEGDSAETLIRNVILQVAGFYIPVEGATTIPGDNTGNPVTSLDLRQNGDQIEAIDNNGIIFKGATVLGINGRRMFQTWYQMENFLLAGQLNLEPIITHELDSAFTVADRMVVLRKGEIHCDEYWIGSQAVAKGNPEDIKGCVQPHVIEFLNEFS